MNISTLLIDLGRTVAFHPSLKKVTGSTTATLLLCQLLYWTPKARDGWIWKTNDEIEEETGLTHNEQKTARLALIELNLIQYEFKRLDHTSRYKVNSQVLNELWDACHVSSATPNKEAEPKKLLIEQLNLPDDLMPSDNNPKETPAVPAPRTTAAVKKGDMMDGILASLTSPANTRITALKVIKDKMESKLRINMDTNKWITFIEFVYTRETKHGEPVENFIKWLKEKGGEMIYWTPERMKSFWPQAFTEDNQPPEDFVKILPKVEEEEYADMPNDLGKKRNLF